MLWGKKDEELPDELKGLTPEQIAAAVKRAKELETELTTTKTSLAEKDTTLATLTSERDTIKTKLDEIEAGRNNPPKNDPPTNDDNPSIWADPDGYIQRQTNETRLTALLSGMMSAKMYCRSGLQGDDLKIFNKYESEIDGIVKSYPDGMKVLPQTWMNALTFIKGQHMGEIMKAKSEGSDFFAETTTTTRHDEPPPQDKLSEAELDTCKSMKWDTAKYLKSKKDLTMIGEGRSGHASYVTGK